MMREAGEAAAVAARPYGFAAHNLRSNLCVSAPLNDFYRCLCLWLCPFSHVYMSINLLLYIILGFLSIFGLFLFSLFLNVIV